MNPSTKTAWDACLNSIRSAEKHQGVVCLSIFRCKGIPTANGRLCRTKAAIVCVYHSLAIVARRTRRRTQETFFRPRNSYAQIAYYLEPKQGYSDE
jgi:hypothetical protein